MLHVRCLEVAGGLASKLGLLRDLQRVRYFDLQVPNCAFKLCGPEAEEFATYENSRFAIDQCGVDSSHRMTMRRR